MSVVKVLSVAVLLCITYVSGTSAKRMSLEEDLTVLIDHEKYQEMFKNRRTQRQVYFSNETDQYDLPVENEYDEEYKKHAEDETRLDIGCTRDCGTKICADPVNELYQRCGNKCVLGCRYASATQSLAPSIAGISLSKFECDKNECVEGCFCKHGLVRHQNKCIPANECPIRKCNRYEVYMCGPASPVTCDNALRGHEILQLTRHIDCVYGCFCAQGYLRNNHNGKCVPDYECRSSKSVEVSPQIPGLFKHVSSCGHGGCGVPVSGCGSKGCGTQYQHGNGCGPHGCANDGDVSYSQPVHYPGLVRPGAFSQLNSNIPGLSVPTIPENCVGRACFGQFSENGVRVPSVVQNTGLPLPAVNLPTGTTNPNPALTTAMIMNSLQGIVGTGILNMRDDQEYDEIDDDELGAPLTIPQSETSTMKVEATTSKLEMLTANSETTTTGLSNTENVIPIETEIKNPQIQVQKPPSPLQKPPSSVQNPQTASIVQNVAIPIQMPSSIVDNKVPTLQTGEQIPVDKNPQINGNVITSQTQLPVSSAGNNQPIAIPNQITNAPNTAAQTSISNPTPQYGNENFVFDPNYGYVPSSVAQNPSVSPSTSNVGATPFDLQEFYNFLNLPYRAQLNRDKTEYYTTNGQNANNGQTAFQSTASQFQVPQSQLIPSKQPDQTNLEYLGNRPNYQPPFINFLSQFKPNFNQLLPNNAGSNGVNGFSFQNAAQNGQLNPLNPFNPFINRFNNPNTNGFFNQGNLGFNGLFGQSVPNGNKQNIGIPNRRQ